MKKSLLSILALALVAVGCQNYDDQFDSLNADIASLTTKVNGLDAGVAAQVTAVAASVANLATQVTALGNSALTTTDLTTALSGVLTNLATVQSELTALDSSVATSIAGVNTTVAALSTQLTAVQTSALTSDDVAALSEVTNLNAEMAAVQAALDELLTASASVNGNVTITNQAELDYVETLMETDGTPANYIINGNLTITADAGDAANFTTGSDYTAAISLLTSKIASVIGAVDIATVTTTTGLDFSQLTYVSGAMDVDGAFNDGASVLATAGSLEVDVNATSFALPNLVSSAGGLRLNDVTSATVSPLTVDVVNLLTGAVTTAAGELQFPDADVNLGAGSPAADTDVKSIIATGVAAIASTDIEASGDVTIGALTVTATVIDGANITLQSGATGSTWGGGSSINATGDIIVNALTINGGASTMTNDGAAGGGMTLGATLIKNLTAVASGTGTIDASAMEENIAGSYSAADVTLTGLVTNTGLLTVLVDTNIQLDALIAGAGAITAEAASTFNAPLFPTDGTINLKDGTAGVANGADVTVKSLTDIADLADAATIKSLTIGAQPANVSLVLSTFAAMSTLNYKGVAATTAAGQTNDLTIGPMAGGSASLTTIDFTGNGGISNLTVMAAGLTSLSTEGALRSITVTSTGAGATAAALDAITLGNTGLNGGTAGVVSITQTGISSLDLSNWNWIKAIELIGNTSMTALTFPSATTTATSAGPGVNKTVTVTANGIAGAITAPVDSTESNVFVESILTGVGFTNAKTWLTWITNQSTGGGVTYTLEIDADDTDIQAVCDDGGTDGVSATAIWNSTSEIDIIGELGLLSN